MAFTRWSLEGFEVTNCNCDYGCPCQFNALPTHGDCRAMTGMEIERGYFGGVRLDGLRWVATFAWPGAVHQGNGTGQHFIDERANAEQRQALTKILAGEETAPGATFFQVFATTLTTLLPPRFVPIEFAVDLEQREARVVIPGVLEPRGEQIRYPVTGDLHRVRVVLPNGFEYTEAEYASGTTRSHGAVALTLDSTHAHMARLHLTQDGVVRP